MNGLTASDWNGAYYTLEVGTTVPGQTLRTGRIIARGTIDEVLYQSVYSSSGIHNPPLFFFQAVINYWSGVRVCGLLQDASNYLKRQRARGRDKRFFACASHRVRAFVSLRAAC